MVPATDHRRSSTSALAGGRSSRPAVRRTLTLLATLACLAAACTPSIGDASASGPKSVGGPATIVDGEIVSNADAGEGTEAPLDPDRTIPVPDPDPTPIGLDDDFQVGTLDNGLRYYVRTNQAPGARLELRLVLRAGSRQQEAADSGIAHFTEHMLFNGTEKFDGNELDRVLQSFGIDFGADINAYTSYDETVYILSVPTFESAINTAFEVLDEWAFAATLAEQAVIDERGVIREEFRIRDESADGVIFDALNRYYIADSPYEGYDPIGTPDQILATTDVDVRRYYDRWYRPDLMSIVAVGDVPADELEQRIIEQFSDLESRSDGQPVGDTAVGDDSVEPLSGVVVDLATHPDAGRPNLSVDMPILSWDPTTIGGERLLVMESIIDRMIANRLEEQIARGEIAAILNSSGSFQIVPGRRFLGFNVTGPDLVAAGEGLLTELRRIQLAGFDASEFERGVAAQRAGLDSFESSLASRQDAGFAGAAVEHALGRGPLERAEDTIARQRALLDELDRRALNDHAAFMLADSDPIVVGIGAAEADLPARDELLAMVDRAAGIAEVEERVEVEAISELMDRPAAGDDPERVELQPLPATELRFDNGVRVVFLPSDIFAGNVNLLALSEGGWSTVDVDDRALVDIALNATNLSGLGSATDLQVEAYLDGSSAQLVAFVDETEEGLSGTSSAEDLEELFQLLHLTITSPRIDPAPLAEAVEQGRGLLERATTDPTTQATIARLQARFDSPWFDFVPSEAQLDGADAERLLAIHRDRIGNTDDLVIAVVGDTELEAVVDLAQAYVATLPAGSTDTPVDRRRDPPSASIVETVDAGENDAAAGVDVFFAAPLTGTPGEDGISIQSTELVLDVLVNILDTRLFEVVREELAATYGGQVSSSIRTSPDVEIETLISISGDPTRLNEISAAVRAEVEDLITNGPNNDEFARARSIVRSDRELVNNFQLMLWLHEAVDDETLGYFGRLDLVDAIELADVAALARVVFDPERAIEIVRS